MLLRLLSQWQLPARCLPLQPAPVELRLLRLRPPEGLVRGRQRVEAAGTAAAEVLRPEEAVPVLRHELPLHLPVRTAPAIRGHIGPALASVVLLLRLLRRPALRALPQLRSVEVAAARLGLGVAFRFGLPRQRRRRRLLVQRRRRRLRWGGQGQQHVVLRPVADPLCVVVPAVPQVGYVPDQRRLGLSTGRSPPLRRPTPVREHLRCCH